MFKRSTVDVLRETEYIIRATPSCVLTGCTTMLRFTLPNPCYKTQEVSILGIVISQKNDSMPRVKSAAKVRFYARRNPEKFWFNCLSLFFVVVVVSNSLVLNEDLHIASSAHGFRLFWVRTS